MLNIPSDGIAVAPAPNFAQTLPVVMRDEQTFTVDARELYAFLQVETPFHKWILRRIEEFGFSEERDFWTKLSESSGGRPGKEYALALDMAKELCMVERNERGRQARLYFIACEKELRGAATRPRSVLDELDVLIAAKQEIVASRAREAALQGEKEQLTAAVVEMLPDQAFCNAVRAAREDLVPSEVAKEIAPALGMGVKEVIDRMVDEDMMFRRGTGKKRRLLPKEGKKYAGWFRMRKEQRWDSTRGEYVPCDQVMITGYGQQQIFKKWNIPEPMRLFPAIEK